MSGCTFMYTMMEDLRPSHCWTTLDRCSSFPWKMMGSPEVVGEVPSELLKGPKKEFNYPFSQISHFGERD